MNWHQHFQYELAHIVSTLFLRSDSTVSRRSGSSIRATKGGSLLTQRPDPNATHTGMHDKTWSKQVVQITGPDDLRETLRGSDIENVQLKPGKMHGSIAHFDLGSLGISMGQFNCGIRM